METEIRVKIEVPADLVLLRPLDAFVRHLIEQLPDFAATEGLASNLELVFNEAFMNIHDHAYKCASSGHVLIEILASPDRLEFRFEDRGQGFDPDRIQQPDPEEPGERGRGVWMIRHFMDEFVYVSKPDGRNILRLVKRLSGQEKDAE